MRLRPVVEISDRHTLKPSIGEGVLFEGTEYIVTSVGSRWIYMYKATDERKTRCMAQIRQVLRKPKGADVEAV